MVSAKTKVTHLLSLADIRVNGDRPWDIKVYNKNFYARVLAQGSVGLGEAYMDGWWDCKKLDVFFAKIIEAKLDEKIKPLSVVFDVFKARFMNMQSKERSKKVAQTHYDLGNKLRKLKILTKHRRISCISSVKSSNSNLE